MPRSYSKDKRDANEPELVEFMQRQGIGVQLLSIGAGADALTAFRRKPALCEIKNPEYMKKSKIVNGKRVKITPMEAAVSMLTEEEKEMRIWCKAMNIPYLIVWDEESVKKAFEIK